MGIYNPVETLGSGQLTVKSRVQITGTQDNPQNFLTGVTPLDVDDRGQPFPQYSVGDIGGVIFRSLQEAAIDGAGFKPTIVGTGLAFQAEVADGGKPSSDGNYYADIFVFMQATS